MQRRKIWQLLDILDAEEKAHFLRWLDAELGERQYYVRRLLQLALEYPRTELQIWEGLYPGQEYDDGRFRKLSHDLTEYLESYMASQAFLKNPLIKDLFLLKSLNEKGSEELFVKTYRKMKVGMEEPGPDEFHAWIAAMREVELRRFHAKHVSRSSEIARKFPPEFWREQLKELHRLVDNLWVKEKLPLLVESSQIKAGPESQGTTALLQEAMGILRRDPAFYKDPVLHVWDLCYKLSTAPTEDDAEALMGLLQLRWKQIESGHIREVHAILYNYYARELAMEGGQEVIEKMLLLTTWGIEQQVILVHGILPASYYRNAISLCLRLQNTVEARRILDAYRHLLSPSEQAEAYSFCLSSVYYHERKFGDFFKLLSATRFHYPPYEINARILYLQAQYELMPEETEWLTGQADNLIRFIRSQKSLPQQAQRDSLNRVRLFRRFVYAEGVPQLIRLLEDVSAVRPKHTSEWLTRQIQTRINNLSSPEP
jgi:hypothetical protein